MSRSPVWIAVGVAATVAALAFRAGRRSATAAWPVERETSDGGEALGATGLSSPEVSPPEVGPADFAGWEHAVPPRDS
jgi:hypothetical protein